MDTYSLLREIADSWGLLGMMVFFIAAIVMLFRPGAKKMHQDAAQIPFKEINDGCSVFDTEQRLEAKDE